MGPWGGFITGLCENVEYVLTPAVIVFFIGSYLGAIFGTPPEWQPVCWVVDLRHLFLALNICRRGAVLQGHAGRDAGWRWRCWSCSGSAPFRIIDFSRWALNIGAADGSVELPEGNGPCFPFGFQGVLATLPFAVWLFLAIEQLPLAAEESVDPKRDMPQGHHARHVHADRLGRS